MEKLTFIEKHELQEIFDVEEIGRIVSHLNQRFSSFLDNESFDIFAGYKDRQIQVTLTLSKKDETFFYPVESLFVYEEITKESLSYYDIALMMLEYLVVYFEEFLLEERRVFLPLDWSVHHSNDLTFFLRGFVRNLKVEKMADHLLSEHGHGDWPITSISSES